MSAEARFADPGKLRRLSSALPELAPPELGRAVREASDVAVREARSNASGLGGIPGSLAARSEGALGAAVYSRHPGAFPQEYGRRAGAPMPPPNVFGADGFPIARAIARRGYRGRFFLRRAADRLARSELRDILARAGDRIADAWGRL